MKPTHLDIRAVNEYMFSHAKNLWAYANMCRLIVFVGGVLAILSSRWAGSVPYIVFVLIVASEVFQWRADAAKRIAETIQRKFDSCESFGKPMSAADRRDIAAVTPPRLRTRFAAEVPEDSYFESTEEPGARRALENLQESTWYSREQSGYMIWVCGILILLVVGLAITALIYASNSLADLPLRQGTSRVVTAWLLLIFALGLFNHLIGYINFRERADRSYRAAGRQCCMR